MGVLPTSNALISNFRGFPGSQEHTRSDPAQVQPAWRPKSMHRCQSRAPFTFPTCTANQLVRKTTVKSSQGLFSMLSVDIESQAWFVTKLGLCHKLHFDFLIFSFFTNSSSQAKQQYTNLRRNCKGWQCEKSGNKRVVISMTEPLDFSSYLRV